MGPLQQFLQQMLASHPKLMQAEAESRGSGYRLKESKAALLPRVNILGNLGYEKQTAESFRRNYNQSLGQARVVMPLLDVGLLAQINSRQASTVVADWSLTDVREDLILQGALAYQELQRHEKLVELARNNLKSHRQYVAQVKQIALSDIGRAADLPAAVSRVALAESVLTSRLGRLESARVHWVQLTGLNAPDELVVTPPPPPTETLEIAISQALRVSPQVQQAKAAIDVARQNVLVTRSLYLPKLNAEFTRKAGSDWGGVIGSQSSYYAGISLEWSAFSGFSDRYATQASNEAVLAAQHAADHLQNELKARVSQVWYELVAGEKSLESFLVYESNAKDVVEAYRNQFQIGRRSLLDVLNAENELFTARSNLVFTTHDNLSAEWRLAALRGELAASLGL
jgi:adhesin transport system outer membrane protein